jgi:hypothetical protein
MTERLNGRVGLNSPWQGRERAGEGEVGVVSSLPATGFRSRLNLVLELTLTYLLACLPACLPALLVTLTSSGCARTD